MKQVDARVWKLIQDVNLTRQLKTFPVAGGWLDQSRPFLEAYRQVETDTQYWRAKHGGV